MRKKLLAGMLALALCSTNMPLQTIFAEEFTSGNPDVVSEEETPEIFTNEEQEAVGETDEELSVFSSEEVPEFNDAPDEAMAAAENEQAGEIDLADNDKVMNGVYTISSAGDYKFTCSRETGNRIVVDGKKISAKDSINIYLNKVNINTSAGPALRINLNVEATVTIHLTGTNSLITKNNYYAGLQKDNKARLIIKTNNSDATAGILNARSIDGDSAGIGGGFYGSVSCSNIIIDSCSVIASSKYGAGIGGSKQRAGSVSDIIINSSSVTASSTDGAGIGGGGYGASSVSGITINSSSPFSSAFFASLSASSSGASARICAFTSSAAFLVRLPTSSRAFSAKAARMACFHACEETLARSTPPYTAVFGLPVSSRLMQLGGTVCKMWKSTYRRLFMINSPFLSHPVQASGRGTGPVPTADEHWRGSAHIAGRRIAIHTGLPQAADNPAGCRHPLPHSTAGSCPADGG